ncbi:hypothetical protein HC031_05150 [Planosporangium thailandense]|uniref:DUF6311 domain-containing protein n=1 Tax=Planosporangium thailandense TaxID=765197 RepID=A0ABX0XT90_9ACTN|nr:hypothetical protein [Planosporangium thailandense]NJC69112.1 hypothetical protein [Planosporangium thailandense]
MTTDHASLGTQSLRTGADRSVPASPRVRDRRAGDWLAAIGYALLALAVTVQLWLHPTGAILQENQQDEVQFEWMLANAVRTLRHLCDPFFTDVVNAPFGVNLMANTSTWGLTLPLAPMTALFGAPVSFRIMLTAAFFGTALSWYHVLSRRVVASRIAAFVGGAFCAFAPGMLGQGTGHPNVVAQFLLPFIVLVVLDLRKPADRVRNGLLLAGLVTYQFFINEEVLLLAALALGVFVVAYWVQRRDVVTPLLRSSLVSLALTTVVVSVIVAYPLYRQFFGRQSYHGLPEWVLEYNTDLASYVGYAQQSLAGTKAGAEHLAQGVSEQNTFYGWGLPVLVLMIVAALWRRAVVRALALTAAVFVLLSLGQYVVVEGEKTPYAGPWRLLAELPLFDTVVPTRLSLVVIPIVGVLLALFVDWIMVEGGRGVGSAGARGAWSPLRVLGIGALAASLVPLLPTPLTVTPRQPAPRFFSTGAWHHSVPDGATVGLLPFGWQSDVTSMQWQTEQGFRFKILGGYFLGPDPTRDDRRGGYGAGPYLVRTVLAEGRQGGRRLSGQERQHCLQQLRSWHATVLLLPENAPNAAAVREGAEQIFGPGRHVEDVWVWRVPGA